MLPFLFRKKEKDKRIDDKKFQKIVQQELGGYVKKEDIEQYFAEIEDDKKKKALWDSLPPKKKLKILRYVMTKKGEHGKK